MGSSYDANSGDPADFFGVQRTSRRQEQLGTIEEPGKQIPLHDQCDVVVVGGGPAGTAAAIAAARLGARTILLERYNHLGGLSTGGLVIWIDRMTDWDGRLVIAGIAAELLDRLPAAQIFGPGSDEWGVRGKERVRHWAPRNAAWHGVVTHSPTLDPEWLKAVSLDLVVESGVHCLFHAWGAKPFLEGRRVGGVIFESKQGRRAIRATVTIDATGDGDLFAGAGAGSDTSVDPSDIHGCINTSWLFGGVDMEAFLRFRVEKPDQFSQFLALGRERFGAFEKANVTWRNDVAVFMGPRFAGYSGLDVEDLTEVQLRSRRSMLDHLTFYRENAPGFGDAHVMLSAPQLGVRHTRRLRGRGALTRECWDGRIALDEIGVSPSLSPKFASVSVPYASLVPDGIDGLLAPGRHMSCDATSHSFMREIPQCWLTGQAAGVAAALAAGRNTPMPDISIDDLQKTLRVQGAYLRTSQESTATVGT